MERNRRNWIYVLGSAEQRDLIESLREGLTRSQLSVYQPGRDLNRSEIASYRPAIDLKEDDSRIEQLLAVQLSIAIVVLATPELYQDEIAVECLNIAEYRRAKVIYVELEPSRKLRSAHSWRVHAVVQKPVSKIQLVKEIARRVRKVLQYV
ncbi:MAG: hypothetical protein OEM76_11390, partial [Gammaproteobacteria bacterium]|nr:hypothetical protein [Gammaproteobacteria bacterium]